MSLVDTHRQAGFAKWKDGEVLTLAIDLDGTICPHDWIDEETIVDPFVGALEFIKKLSERYNVVIFSARATRPKGKIAICNWLVKHGMSVYVCDVTNQKSYNFYKFIDDRAIVFSEPNDYNNILNQLGCNDD